MFVHFNGKICNADIINNIDYSKLVSDGFITVNFYYLPGEKVSGPEAINVIMALCPDALEGHQAKYIKHAWAIHNLIGHPMMQICSWVGLTKLGIKIHDMTAPNPITK